jgi:hypothetical protein
MKEIEKENCVYAFGGVCTRHEGICGEESQLHSF